MGNEAHREVSIRGRACAQDTPEVQVSCSSLSSSQHMLSTPGLAEVALTTNDAADCTPGQSISQKPMHGDNR